MVLFICRVHEESQPIFPKGSRSFEIKTPSYEACILRKTVCGETFFRCAVAKTVNTERSKKPHPCRGRRTVGPFAFGENNTNSREVATKEQ